jgi:CheY-like chemotaxis protein
MKDLLERSIGPTIRLSFALTTRPAIALIDANQVELALLNLAVNARDAMPDGGELRVAVDFANCADVGELHDGDFVHISVEDTGSGMDEETLRRAVDPFFSTKELGKGTGLGLSMVHGLAVQLHGALCLHSVVGKGTRVDLYFPATREIAERRTEKDVRIESVAQRARILLVDDDALVAMSSIDMLADLGHEVLEANSGEQALDVLRSTDAVDLLITDFAMPGMTGMQLIQAARILLPELPVLLATGYAELPNGNLDVPRIGKPYTQTQLASEVMKLLR